MISRTVSSTHKSGSTIASSAPANRMLEHIPETFGTRGRRPSAGSHGEITSTTDRWGHNNPTQPQSGDLAINAAVNRSASSET